MSFDPTFDPEVIIEQLTQSDQLIEFVTQPARALMLIGQLQLALRHPGNTGEAADAAREFVTNLANAIAETTGIEGVREFVAAGWHPEFDLNHAEAEAAFDPGCGPNAQLEVMSAVRKDYSPAVRVRWGENAGTLTLQEAHAVAMDLMEATIAAEMDGTVIRWAVEKLGSEERYAYGLLHELRRMREAGEVPSTTLNFDGERLRPDSVKNMAMQLLFNAFNAETEAMLAKLLITRVNIPDSVVGLVIAELREMRDLQTMDPEGDG